MAEISVVASGSAVFPSRPYAPSWFDRFTDWVDSLPVPAPVFYLVLALLLALTQVLIQWDAAAGVIYGFPLLYVVTLAYHLAFMHYLDKMAGNALARFRPLLSISDAEYDELLYRLTTLPTRPVWIAGFIGLVYGFSTLIWVPFSVQVNELHFVDTPLSIFFNRAFAPVIFFVLGAMVYHAVHQLNVVREIYDHSLRIDLFTLRPLYAFSTLSGLTAVGIGFITYLWFQLTPSLFVMNLAFFLFLSGVALLTFILPLRGAHRQLDEEKEQRLAENGERQRIIIAELHRRVDVSDLLEMDSLNKTMSSLEMERTMLEHVSTWPWKPETPRAVVAALLFPVVVWLMQWLLERVLT